jgi:CRISPR-associated protein Cas1
MNTISRLGSDTQNFEALHWHRATLQLVPARQIGNGTPALIILNAFLKSIKSKNEPNRKIKLAFRVADVYAHRLKKRAGEAFTLEVDFFGADEEWMSYWLVALHHHLTLNAQAGFAIATAPTVTECHFDFKQSSDVHTHVQLEFLAPLPFKRETGSSRTHLSAEIFFAQLVRRAGQLFDTKFIAPDISGVQVQSDYWNYTELRHASKSQPGNTQYYNGCFGRLYFSGNLNSVLPWLKLAAVIHAGGSVELNPLGYCRLHLNSMPLPDTQLNPPMNLKDPLLGAADTHDNWQQPVGKQEATESTLADVLTPPAKKTIYITEPGCFLGHSGDALEIRQDGKSMDAIPLRRVASVVVLAPVSLSSGFIQRCARLGIPVTLTFGGGDQVASLSLGSRKHYNIAAAQAIHYAKLTAAERLALAKGFAMGKIINCKPLVNSRHDKGNADLLQTLDECIAGIDHATDINSVRGYEGRAAKLMFATLNNYIKVPKFHFEKRLRENPDRMNVLFNFGYHLLFTRLNTMLRAAGLNPYLGFLHDGEDDYETLVCDVQELFRAAIDRHLIALVNLRIIKPDDFSKKDQSLRLAPMAIKRFVEHFERLLHSDAGGISLLEAMQEQVQALVCCVTEDKSLLYFNYQHAVNFRRAVTEETGDAEIQQTVEDKSALWDEEEFEMQPEQS